MLVLAIADLRSLLTTADVTAAMSVEGLLGTDRVFAADLQALRPQHGERAAANLARSSPAARSSASHRGPAGRPRARRVLAALLAGRRRRRP